jgi:hypothetical protein
VPDDDDDDDDEVTRTASWWPNPAKWAANVAFGSGTDTQRCPRHVRFTPISRHSSALTDVRFGPYSCTAAKRPLFDHLVGAADQR